VRADIDRQEDSRLLRSVVAIDQIPKALKIRGIISPVDHAMTISAQHSEVSSYVVYNRCSFSEVRHRSEVVCFNKALPMTPYRSAKARERGTRFGRKPLECGS
jgi:hypothetical protein